MLALATQERLAKGDAFRAIPAIQGQPAGYLQVQLTILKENKR